VAKECLNVWGVICLVIPERVAYFLIIFQNPTRENFLPEGFKKRIFGSRTDGLESALWEGLTFFK